MVANPFNVAIDWSTVTLDGDPIADTYRARFLVRRYLSHGGLHNRQHGPWPRLLADA